MKKITSFLLAFVLVFSLSVPAFADSAPNSYFVSLMQSSLLAHGVSDYESLYDNLIVPSLDYKYYISSESVASDGLINISYLFFIDKPTSFSVGSKPNSYFITSSSSIFIDTFNVHSVDNVGLTYGIRPSYSSFYIYPSKIKSNFAFTLPDGTVVKPEEPDVPEDPTPDFGEDKTNGFVGDYGCRILLPRNGFQQSKLNAIAVKTYYKIPFDGDSSKVGLKVNGYTGDNQQITFHKVNYLNNKTVLEGYLDFAGAVQWNKQTTITFTVTDYTGKSYSSSVNVLCYDDFVDKDGDGKDDRTNDDDWNGNPDFNKPIYPDNSPPTDGSVISWFQWFFNSVGDFFTTLKSGFDSIVAVCGDFVSFLNVGFSYVPKEIFTCLGFGIIAIVFCRILGR